MANHVQGDPSALGLSRVSGILELGNALGFCTAGFLSSLAYQSAEQKTQTPINQLNKKPKHCLTPGFLIPLGITFDVIILKDPPPLCSIGAQLLICIHANKRYALS